MNLLRSLCTLLSQLTGLPVLFVRKKAKEYGTCKIAEGGQVRGRRLLVVEDVVTSGGAILDAAQALREEGADSQALGKAVRAVFTQALLELTQSRAREGARLEGLIRQRCATLLEMIAATRARLPEAQAQINKNKNPVTP